MSTITKRSISALVAGSALISSFAVTSTAFAETRGAGEGLEDSHRPVMQGRFASTTATTTKMFLERERLEKVLERKRRMETASHTPEGIGRGLERKMEMRNASNTPAVIGNGQPVVGGTVTAVAGNSITITNKSNVTYTVDISTAKIIGRPSATASSTAAAIAVGDNVIVQGAVNGNTINAVSVIAQGVAPATPPAQNPPRRGVFNAIGGFFSHMFGF